MNTLFIGAYLFFKFTYSSHERYNIESYDLLDFICYIVVCWTIQRQRMCDRFNVTFHYYRYTFFLQTQWKDHENVKALMEILLYVIDNNLLEVYCQVIISIWVVLYRCTWSYKNSGQLKRNEIECQVLWTVNSISACCRNSPTGCGVYRPRYISCNVNDAGCNLWNPFG
jgi:hypothetical protein